MTESKWFSRKLFMALVGALVMVANEGFGWNLDSTTILGFAGIVAGYIFAQGAVDYANAKSTKVITTRNYNQHVSSQDYGAGNVQQAPY